MSLVKNGIKNWMNIVNPLSGSFSQQNAAQSNKCAGNSDCYLAYSQEANKHFKEQLNAYLAHVSEGKDFESLARNYYPDDAYFTFNLVWLNKFRATKKQRKV